MHNVVLKTANWRSCLLESSTGSPLTSAIAASASVQNTDRVLSSSLRNA